MNQESPCQESDAHCEIQQNEDTHEEVIIENTRNTREKFKWSEYNDEDLCTSWLNFTNDSIKGTDQSKDKYWQNIVNYYNQWKREGPTITIYQATNHWYKMSADVSKFNGCYIQLKNSHPSGHDEDLLITKAKEIFKSQNKNRKFSYLHSWKILRAAQKWKEFVDPRNGSSKRTKISSSGVYNTSSSNPNTSDTCNIEEISEERPLGQKAAKAATRKKDKAKKTVGAIDEKWDKYKEMQSKRLLLCENVIRQKDEEIRQKDFAILCKETLNMDERARKNHEQVCEIIRAKYGMS